MDDTLNSVLSGAMAGISNMLNPPLASTNIVQTTAYPTMTPAFSWLNPSTWTMTTWLLVGGGIFLLTGGFKRNPIGSVLLENPRRRRRRSHRRNPYPASGFVTGLARNPVSYGGSAAMTLVRANPRRRKSHHTSKGRLKFHGAFSHLSDAEAKAARLGGWIKSFSLRGHQRYSVVTAA